MNPFSGLLYSRKFWLLVLDTVLGISVYFVNKYASASFAADANIIFGLLQPMFVAVIVGIFTEDNAQRRLEEAKYSTDAWVAKDPMKLLSVEESEGQG